MILRILKNFSNFTLMVFKMVKMIWSVHPISCIGLLVLELIQGLVPLATAWVTKVLFDELALSLHKSTATIILPRILLFLLITQACLNILGQMIAPMNQYLITELGRKLSLKIQRDIYLKINSFVGLSYLEDPKFHDIIQLAGYGTQSSSLQTLSLFTTLIRSIITIFAFLIVLISFSPLLTSVIVLAVIPQLYTQFKLGRQRFGLASNNSHKERLASYYGRILSDISFAKEIRLFNLANYFLNAFTHVIHLLHQAQRNQQVKEMRWQVILSLLTSVIASGTFLAVAIQAFLGHISLGDVTLYMSAVTTLQSTLFGLIIAFSQMDQSVLFYRQYIALLALTEPLRLTSLSRPMPSLQSGITLHNVSFRYSEQHEWVLHHVNLYIPVGKCLALVGLNGAGKSTLVKLLTRLYDPTEGQILWDGIDILEYDPQDLRQHIGTIFQDFAHYDLTANENIGLGEVTQVENTSSIRRAAIRAGVHELIEGWHQGYQTVLSRWLASDGSGVDLSGGEWQKIALARMFMREADMLILDEPTAALDAQAEYNLHHLLVELMVGRTTLLITHRFNTVRMADIIAVLENGQITEFGTHDELILRKEAYAKLYNMQAEQYQ